MVTHIIPGRGALSASFRPQLSSAAAISGSELAEEVRDKLLGALKRSTAGLERERKRRAERVNDLKNQRRRLVQGHLAGVIPMDLVKEERERIEIELYDAEQQLLETAVDWDTVETNLTLAMGLVSDCQQAYRRGGPRVRRRYNQAFWEAIYVDVDGVSYGRLAALFHQVLPPEITERIDTTKNPDAHRRGRGLSKNDLVETMGLEPTTPCLQSRCSSQLSYVPRCRPWSSGPLPPEWPVPA